MVMISSKTSQHLSRKWTLLRVTMDAISPQMTESRFSAEVLSIVD